MIWFRKVLLKNRDLNRPIFVYCHYPIQGTVASSLGEFTKGAFTGIWGEFVLGSPHTMYVRDNKLPTIFNTSSASQVADCRDGIKKKGNGSKGYFVYVYEDKIILRGYDFKADKWIPSAQFYVDFN